MNIIDVFTFTTTNSKSYAEYLRYYGEKFKSGNNIINWKYIESNGSDGHPDGYEFICKAPILDHNSKNHASGLDIVQDHIINKYNVLIDVDTVLLYPNWDELIIEKLNQFDCFGVSNGDKIKYPNCPTVYFFSFKKELTDKLRLDFYPDITKSGKPKKIKLTKKHKPELYNMKEGDILKCDTGWKIPYQLNSNDLSYESLLMVLMTDKNSLLPFKDDKHKKFCFEKPTHHAEWQYDGQLFLTHKQASRSHSIKSSRGKSWTDRINLYLKRKN